MLQLKNIKKDYLAGENTVHALKGIDLSFRKSEFVSILGPSGCGKTTMLNIIGGLDQYTEGDLVINGRSTKDFKDRDWDAYRNHSIGFVFQSYNLIPHQSVLQNVELALTLSGVSKSERRARAKKALEDVGLGDQLKKKPSEMSGGQMQRVAIARALVNNPDIILADEPTGALDTETSVQVMEILKKISEERLIIMVTHNPDLAETYSTRIIRMLDGLITSDSAPLTYDEQSELQTVIIPAVGKKKEKKPSMSFATSFGLSLKNLFTKKGRTILTSFAGSIGIIGIALILAVSQGMTTYINDVQESTLSAYPITLEATTVDVSTLMQAFMNVTQDGDVHENDAVYQKDAIYNMVDAMTNIEESENDLKAFNEFLLAEIKDPETELAKAVNGIQYSYDFDMLIYTKSVDGKILHTDLEKIISDLMIQYLGADMSAMTTMAELNPMSSMVTSMSSTSTSLWQELLPGENGAPVNDLILDQYDVVYGSWPNNYDEIVLVLDENNEIDDIALYALGLVSEEYIDDLAQAAINGAELKEKEEFRVTYEEICQTEYKTILNADCYHYDETTGLYTDLRETEAGLKYLYDNALSLKVTGIVRPAEDADTKMLKGNICYTEALTKYIVEKAHNTEVIKAQLAAPNKDLITGKPFNSSTGTLTDAEKETAFKEYIEDMNVQEKATAYTAISCVPPKELMEQQTAEALEGMNRQQIEATISQGMAQEMSVTQEEITEYLASMTDEEIKELFTPMIQENIRKQYAEGVMAQLVGLGTEQLAGALDAAIPVYTTEQCALYYDEVMDFSDSTYEENLRAMGYVDLEHPDAINIYASSFENKDVITDAISRYNETVDELKEIKYTDYLGIMMSSITTIINAITYVLIAFVAISLIVSSIMIGVITLISVQERTKEIGILRAIGASKKNVSRMFNAETMIIGFTSGLLGVLVTYLLCIPVNLILNALTGIDNLKAILPVEGAIILVIISVLLTLFAGIIPSRSAAKKDPVVALRTE